MASELTTALDILLKASPALKQCLLADLNTHLNNIRVLGKREQLTANDLQGMLLRWSITSQAIAPDPEPEELPDAAIRQNLMRRFSDDLKAEDIVRGAHQHGAIPTTGDL
jgi:predicted O-linked N-acetylglucosamine transferase (SPINDLY family)